MVTWILIVLILGIVLGVVALSGAPIRIRWLVTSLGLLFLIVYVVTTLW